MSEYSADDCGGPDVCSGCSSWRHGVYEDGSGDPAALQVMRRVRGSAKLRAKKSKQLRPREG